jgi:hypothetical protein
MHTLEVSGPASPRLRLSIARLIQGECRQMGAGPATQFLATHLALQYYRLHEVTYCWPDLARTAISIYQSLFEVCHKTAHSGQACSLLEAVNFTLHFRNPIELILVLARELACGDEVAGLAICLVNRLLLVAQGLAVECGGLARAAVEVGCRVLRGTRLGADPGLVSMLMGCLTVQERNDPVKLRERGWAALRGEYFESDSG